MDVIGALILILAAIVVFIIVLQPPGKPKSPNKTIEKIKEKLCSHEWEEFGGPSNSRFEDKVFSCKKCGRIGFPKDQT